MIKAAIFDMDGILIDSEPLWQEAESKVFATVGVHLTREMCMETMGIRVDEVVKFRYDQHESHNKSLQQVEDEILAELQHLIRQHGQPAPGVHHILDFFKARQLRLALASSSHFSVISAVLDCLALTDTFEVVHSGEAEEYGKPHPAIYLTTLEKLELKPAEAIAIEDSFNGLIAAKSARLKTLVVPEVTQWAEARFGCADVKLRSLADFSQQHWDKLSAQS